MVDAPAADGLDRIEREGARVLVLDEHDRLLMLQGHDPHEPHRRWWFTPGGGIDPGEDAATCAVRELLEETGIALSPADLEGPVWERTALFDFMSRPYVQHEVFFVTRLRTAPDVAETAWTATEEETIDAVAWLTAAELAESPLEVFPRELREDWDEFVHWNGVTRDVGEVSE